MRILRKLAARQYVRYKVEKFDYLYHCALRQGIILFSMPKCAGSTLKRIVQLLEVGGDSSRLPANVHDKQASPLCGFLEAPGPVSRYFVGDDFFRFFFVRNPYTRILSCYLDKFENDATGRFARKLGFRPGDAISFKAFLEKLQDDRLLHLNPHWAPQFYLASPDRIEYHFIGKFENLQSDIRAVLQQIDPEGIHRELLNVSERPHQTGAASRIADYYGAEEARLVREIYREDFSSFSYSDALEDALNGGADGPAAQRMHHP